MLSKTPILPMALALICLAWLPATAQSPPSGDEPSQGDATWDETTEADSEAAEDADTEEAEEASDESEAAQEEATDEASDEAEEAPADEADEAEATQDEAPADESDSAPTEDEEAVAVEEEEEADDEKSAAENAAAANESPEDDAPTEVAPEESPPASPPPPGDGQMSVEERAEAERLSDETQAQDTPPPAPDETPEDPTLPKFDAEMARSELVSNPDVDPEIERQFPDEAIAIYRTHDGSNGCSELEGSDCVQRIKAAGGHQARSYPERSTCEGLSGGNGCMSFDGKGWFPRCDPTHTNVLVVSGRQIPDRFEGFLDLTGGARLSQVVELVEGDTSLLQAWCAKKP